jgi:NAD(P)H-hydrate epimerase
VIEFIQEMLLKQPLSRPLILDADALNTLAGVPEWWRQLADDAILTPHPGEMARLAGVTIGEVQSDRVSSVEEAARRWHKTIVLKGAYTVIAAHEGTTRISPVANPGLASAGTGDVLAGVIAGLVAQGLSLEHAAAGGVYLHGLAGEMVREKLGDTGMLATDLLPELPLAIKQLRGLDRLSAGG